VRHEERPRALVQEDAARASELGDVLPGVHKRRDALEIDQLPAWFTGTDKLRTRTARANLQALVLTGARREELAGLPRAKFKDGTPNPYVFASTMSASGRIAEPRAPHDLVLTDAGIPHVSIHGLRRTFSLLGEAAGAPAGAIAQVMGHKPSAIGYR
jgi:hypothetical protein